MVSCVPVLPLYFYVVLGIYFECFEYTGLVLGLGFKCVVLLGKMGFLAPTVPFRPRGTGPIISRSRIRLEASSTSHRLTFKERRVDLVLLLLPIGKLSHCHTKCLTEI